MFDAAGSWELEGTPPRFLFHSSPAEACGMNHRGQQADSVILAAGREPTLYRNSGAARLHHNGDSRPARLPSNGGFSLVECLVALSILSMAGSALLLSSQASSESTSYAVERTVAEGIANQLVDETLGLPYKEKTESPFVWPLQPDSGELTVPVRRALFDDTDDFNGYAASPPQDASAIPLGQGDGQGGLRLTAFAVPSSLFNGWSVTITVTYVDETDLSVDLPAGTTSGFRAINVVVSRSEAGSTRTLATVRRVYGYVPPPV